LTRQLKIGHLISLIIGGLIYILFRSNSLLMFEWFALLGILDLVIFCRGMIDPILHLIPSWILYSAPDGLWMFSYMCFILMVWGNSIDYKNLIWIILLPLYAFYTEFGQFFGFVSGTFDFLDLFFYFLGCLFPFILYTRKIKFNFNSKFF